MAKLAWFGASGSNRRIVWVICLGLIGFAVLGYASHAFFDTMGVGILVIGLNVFLTSGSKPESN
jgi:hypothetical protein